MFCINIFSINLFWKRNIFHRNALIFWFVDVILRNLVQIRSDHGGTCKHPLVHPWFKICKSRYSAKVIFWILSQQQWSTEFKVHKKSSWVEAEVGPKVVRSNEKDVHPLRLTSSMWNWNKNYDVEMMAMAQNDQTLMVYPCNDQNSFDKVTTLKISLTSKTTGRRQRLQMANSFMIVNSTFTFFQINPATIWSQTPKKSLSATWRRKISLNVLQQYAQCWFQMFF